MDFFELLSFECPIEGLVILSTCNRTELYYEYENHIGEEKKIFHLIMKCLVKFKKYSEGLSPYVSTKNGSSEVSRHLFRLISGLESMIIAADKNETFLHPDHPDCHGKKSVQSFQNCSSTHCSTFQKLSKGPRNNQSGYIVHIFLMS